MTMLQLVDNQGYTIGMAEKIAAHEQGGILHRAVSVLLFDAQGRILIQRRAGCKYHFAGKWANASCTHPHHSESPGEAGRRAIRQELGIETTLKEVTQFIYLAHDPESGYTEREYDHVLVGYWSEALNPNPEEVSETEWVSAGELRNRIEEVPEVFAFWFRQILVELAGLSRSELIESPELHDFVTKFGS